MQPSDERANVMRVKRVLLEESVLTLAVILLLAATYSLPPEVKESLALRASNPSLPALLTYNYVHFDPAHLLGNILMYAVCVIIYLALLLTLSEVSQRELLKMRLLTHLSALLLTPLASSLAWLLFVHSLVPQLAYATTCGFSSTVAAYFGIIAALWAVLTAEAGAQCPRTLCLLLQLLFLILMPWVRYSGYSDHSIATQLASLLAPYESLFSAGLALLLAVRGKPRRALQALAERLFRGRPGSSFTAFLLLLMYPSFAVIQLESLFPREFILQDFIVNVPLHLIGLVLGYTTSLLPARGFSGKSKPGLLREGREPGA